jgi:hypothetical protein
MIKNKIRSLNFCAYIVRTYADWVSANLKSLEINYMIIKL